MIIGPYKHALDNIKHVNIPEKLLNAMNLW